MTGYAGWPGSLISACALIMLHPLAPYSSDHARDASKTATTRAAGPSPAAASRPASSSRQRSSRPARYSTTICSFEPKRSYSVFLVTPASAAMLSTPTAWMPCS